MLFSALLTTVASLTSFKITATTFQILRDSLLLHRNILNIPDKLAMHNNKPKRIKRTERFCRDRADARPLRAGIACPYLIQIDFSSATTAIWYLAVSHVSDCLSKAEMTVASLYAANKTPQSANSPSDEDGNETHGGQSALMVNMIRTRSSSISEHGHIGV